MNKTSDSNKTHTRSDYLQYRIPCKICLGIGKRKSKFFKSCYALKYHLREHNREDEIVSGITRKEILYVTRAITKAMEWNILINPCRGIGI